MKDYKEAINPPNNMQEEQKQRFRIRNISVFYSHFILVSSVLLMSIVMLYVSTQISLRTLTEKNLNDLQFRLEQNCVRISDMFGEAYSIPSIIEQTKYYSYIRTETGGYLDNKYVAVLDYMGRTLQIPNYLAKDSEECLVYLRGTNSVCGKSRVFTDANACFSSHMVYEKTTPEELLAILRDRKGLSILPMETVKIGTSTPKRQLTVVIGDSTYPMSVLCTYSEEALLDHLEMDALPVGTHFQIVSNNGTVLEAYPEVVSENVRETSYELTAELPFLKATATMWIPESHFSQLLQPSVRISGLIILATAVIGFGLSFAFANLSTKPLRKLVYRHTPKLSLGYHPNEIQQLENLLSFSYSESNKLKKDLLSSLLIRAFTGSVLSKEDTIWIKEQLGWEQATYRIAIFDVDGETNQVQIALQLSESLSGDPYCYPVSEQEIGVLIQNGEGHMQKLQEEIRALNQLLSDNGHYICGGVSGPMEDFSKFHIAVRQARASIIKHTPISVFSHNVTQLQSAVTWLQHERLYQCVLMGNQENSQSILDEIAGDVHGHNSCREAFYNVRFILRSAAEELTIKYEDHEIPSYSTDIPAWENIAKLKLMLHALFFHMKEREEDQQLGQAEQILAWIDNHYLDPALCVASVAEQFAIPIRRVSALVLATTEMRFNEYILSLRMKKACALLCATQLSVEQIALQSGFTAESTFYRVFKKYFGVTTKEYRQNGGIIKPTSLQENGWNEDGEK